MTFFTLGAWVIGWGLVALTVAAMNSADENNYRVAYQRYHRDRVAWEQYWQNQQLAQLRAIRGG